MKISEEEQNDIFKRLKLAMLQDKKKNPNTYETPCNSSQALSKAERYEAEKVLLMELTNILGYPAKIYPEFE